MKHETSLASFSQFRNPVRRQQQGGFVFDIGGLRAIRLDLRSSFRPVKMRMSFLQPGPTGDLLAALAQVPDPRGLQGRRHPQRGDRTAQLFHLG